jgi:hypothetical protein
VRITSNLKVQNSYSARIPSCARDRTIDSHMIMVVGDGQLSYRGMSTYSLSGLCPTVSVFGTETISWNNVCLNIVKHICK